MISQLKLLFDLNAILCWRTTFCMSSSSSLLPTAVATMILFPSYLNRSTESESRAFNTYMICIICRIHSIILFLIAGNIYRYRSDYYYIFAAARWCTSPQFIALAKSTVLKPHGKNSFPVSKLLIWIALNRRGKRIYRLWSREEKLYANL